MTDFKKAIESAEKIWEDSLDRSILFFETAPPSIKCMIIEDWARIILDVFMEKK